MRGVEEGRVSRPPGPSKRTSKMTTGGSYAVTSEERNKILEDLQRKDDASGKKTLSRIVVEKYLSQYDWYWPRRLEKGSPQLSKAWAYYEHNTLPRYLTGEADANHIYRKAERGECLEETELYPSLRLPKRAFIEWGAGMDLYFISVWYMAFVMLICGCINVLSILHFRSKDYNGNETSIGDGDFWIQGSAVCINTAWVVCNDCQTSDWDQRPNNAPERFAVLGEAHGLENEVTLVKRNLCKFDDSFLGWPNYITLTFLLVVMGFFNLYLRAREVRFDEDKLTTTDYSLMVTNPPPDAKDPDEWREFFDTYADNQGDQVTAITVALDNQDLVNKLANRRVARHSLGYKLGDSVDLDDETAVRLAIDKHNQEMADKPVGCIGMMLKCLRPILKLVGFMLNADELYANINKWTEDIKELQEKEYHAVRVYVTYEQENGQRTALEALKVGTTDLKANRTDARSPESLFRGKHILNTLEPAEPSAIRYLELGFNRVNRLTRRFINLSITVVLLLIASYLITNARNATGAASAGYLTTFFNTFIPTVIKLLMFIEKHENEGRYQRSVYFKLTLFRWTLSGFLTGIIVPYTSTLGNEKTDLIPAIAGLLFAELWLTPLLKLTDITPNLYKHILAPRANSQDEMNSWFNGSWFQLGERYTDFTKILFMVFYYSALFPAGFFFGFVILLTQYYLDKFSLTRLWRPTPKLGADLATFSRRFFFTICLVAFAVVGAIWWAQYPYDNLCSPLEESVAWEGDITFSNVTDLANNLIQGGNNLARDNNGDLIDGQVTVDGFEYVYCNQDWRSWPGFPFPFPATSRVQKKSGGGNWFVSANEDELQWMDPSQTDFTVIYGWTSTVVFLVLVIGLFAKSVYRRSISFFVGVYEEEGARQNIDFSSNVEIFGYVPEVKKGGKTFPFLCCDTDDYDENLISWIDVAHRSYDQHNLIFDVPHKSLRRQEMLDEDPLFEEKDMDGFHRSRYPGKTRRPLDYKKSIYSIAKHYPTKWQFNLAKKEGIIF